MFDSLVNHPKLCRYYERCVTALGDIKRFRYPFFLVYDPGSYRVRGKALREIQKLLTPGDILLRRYDNYLDSAFIPGTYSHAGLFVGDDTVVHAVAEGVTEEDILDYCRCDGVVALRGRALTDADKVAACAYARQQIGKPYDFYVDFTSTKAFCCSELVLRAYDGKLPLRAHTVTRMWGLLRADVVTPDDFRNCDAFDVVFECRGVCGRKRECLWSHPGGCEAGHEEGHSRSLDGKMALAERK